ncbi:hypothetical protein EDD16DRAFT_1517185 [Pisolithus croceorrhizus]|nr:hypothetical protein EV401DRAFT_2201127 [Pisolithus croceorrhizus]KAI6125383.1 hypothetical protein EDD16DRAFT_1517185 [Pisolithus croceorrhizus]
MNTPRRCNRIYAWITCWSKREYFWLGQFMSTNFSRLFIALPPARQGESREHSRAKETRRREELSILLEGSQKVLFAVTSFWHITTRKVRGLVRSTKEGVYSHETSNIAIRARRSSSSELLLQRKRSDKQCAQSYSSIITLEVSPGKFNDLLPPAHQPSEENHLIMLYGCDCDHITGDRVESYGFLGNVLGVKQQTMKQLQKHAGHYTLDDGGRENTSGC